MALLKGKVKFWELPVNWLIVFFGNLAGMLCYVAFIGEQASQISIRVPTDVFSALFRTICHTGDDLLLPVSLGRQDHSGLGGMSVEGYRLQLPR